MLIAILRYILGYVRFSVKGEFPERLFNQLSSRNISVWDMRRNGKSITACMRTADYMKIREYRGKNRVFTRVNERHGLPFLLKRYRLRVGFALGVGLYLFLLVFLSNFVWNVEVTGNERLEKSEILAACEELGIYEGAALASIDQQQLPVKLALKIDGIAWASVNIEGVKVTVNISETIETEKYDGTPCNLVAARDGVITKIEVTNGSTVVTLGQTVQKGDLLVSGVTEFKDGTSNVGVSSGAVYAKTERSLSVFAPFEVYETVAVGEPKKKKVLSFFGLDIPLYLGSFKGEYEVTYDTEFFSSNGMYLPMSFTTATFTPIREECVMLSEEQAEQQADTSLEELEKAELSDAEIMSREVTKEVTPEGVRLTATYVCRENIAEKDLLLIYATK